MVSRQKQVDEEALADLAYRKLNLGRDAWLVECFPFPSSGHVSVRTTDVRAGRHVDRNVAYRTAAELEPAFLSAVSESVAELRRSGGDRT